MSAIKLAAEIKACAGQFAAAAASLKNTQSTDKNIANQTALVGQAKRLSARLKAIKAHTAYGELPALSAADCTKAGVKTPAQITAFLAAHATDEAALNSTAASAMAAIAKIAVTDLSKAANPIAPAPNYTIALQMHIDSEARALGLGFKDFVDMLTYAASKNSEKRACAAQGAKWRDSCILVQKNISSATYVKANGIISAWNFIGKLPELEIVEVL